MADKKIVYNVKKIQHPDITKVIYTDASMHGWGHTMKEFQLERTWINTEKNWHINALE